MYYMPLILAIKAIIHTYIVSNENDEQIIAKHPFLNKILNTYSIAIGPWASYL